VLKRTIIATLTALAALFAVLALVIKPKPEPEYGGKKLREWVAKLPLSDPDRVAAKAIREMGTNTLPYLMEWIGYETPTWKSQAYWAANRILWAKRTPFNDEDLSLRSVGAIAALHALGTNAAPEIGNLIRMANDTKRSESRRWAIAALRWMGVAALPTIVGVLTNEPNRTKESSYLRVECAIAISKLAFEDPDTARLAEPTLRRMCEETNAMTRAFATNTLRELDPERIERMRRLRKAREDR